jgi:urease gamma subunit
MPHSSLSPSLSIDRLPDEVVYSVADMVRAKKSDAVVINKVHAVDSSSMDVISVSGKRDRRSVFEVMKVGVGVSLHL